MRDRVRKPLVTFLVLGLIITSWVGGLYFMQTESYDYEYTVKAEQVESNANVTDEVAFENLSDGEQRVLHDAFKRSDHFLGGAEAVVIVDEKMNVSNSWRVVSIDGVPMLMSIQGPEKDTNMRNEGLGIVAMIVAVGATMFGIPGLIDYHT